MEEQIVSFTRIISPKRKHFEQWRYECCNYINCKQSIHITSLAKTVRAK